MEDPCCWCFLLCDFVAIESYHVIKDLVHQTCLSNNDIHITIRFKGMGDFEPRKFLILPTSLSMNFRHLHKLLIVTFLFFVMIMRVSVIIHLAIQEPKCEMDLHYQKWLFPIQICVHPLFHLVLCIIQYVDLCFVCSRAG